MIKLTTSKRCGELIESPIRKFLPLVRQAEERRIEVLKVNVGDPDLATPVSILKEIRNCNLEHIGYAPSPGIKEHVLG